MRSSCGALDRSDWPAGCRASATGSRARTIAISAWSFCRGGSLVGGEPPVLQCCCCLWEAAPASVPDAWRSQGALLPALACLQLTLASASCHSRYHRRRRCCRRYARKHFPSSRYLDYAISVEEYTLQKVLLALVLLQYCCCRAAAPCRAGSRGGDVSTVVGLAAAASCRRRSWHHLVPPHCH